MLELELRKSCRMSYIDKTSSTIVTYNNIANILTLLLTHLVSK
jgi:hypothetical protein